MEEELRAAEEMSMLNAIKSTIQAANEVIQYPQEIAVWLLEKEQDPVVCLYWGPSSVRPFSSHRRTQGTERSYYWGTYAATPSKAISDGECRAQALGSARSKRIEVEARVDRGVRIGLIIALAQDQLEARQKLVELGAFPLTEAHADALGELPERELAATSPSLREAVELALLYAGSYAPLRAMRAHGYTNPTTVKDVLLAALAATDS